MKDNLSIVITMFIFVILIIIFPLYNYFERQDDMSYNIVLKATTNFVDEVVESGYIDQGMYDKFVDEIGRTGNIYDVEVEAHKKILVDYKNANDEIKNDIIQEYLIKYNDDIFEEINSKDVSNNLNKRVLKNQSYYLEEGDQFYVRVKNSNTTMAGAIFNTIVPTSSPDRIVVDYGGIVKNTSWNFVDSEYNALQKFVTLNFGGEHCKVSAKMNGENITSGSQVLVGSEVTLEVTDIDAGYIDEVEWYENNNLITPNPGKTINISLNESATYTAKITKKNLQSIYIHVNDINMGTVEILDILYNSSSIKEECSNFESPNGNIYDIKVPKDYDRSKIKVKVKAMPKRAEIVFDRWTRTYKPYGYGESKTKDIDKNPNNIEVTVGDFETNEYYTAIFKKRKYDIDHLELVLNYVEGDRKNIKIPTKAYNEFRVTTYEINEPTSIYGYFNICYKDANGNMQSTDKFDKDLFNTTDIRFKYTNTYEIRYRESWYVHYLIGLDLEKVYGIELKKNKNSGSQSFNGVTWKKGDCLFNLYIEISEGKQFKATFSGLRASVDGKSVDIIIVEDYD